MFNPEIGFIGDTSNGSMLSEEKANLLATVCFIRKYFFALELYAFEKRDSWFGVMNLPAGQYHIQKSHSVRRPNCLVFLARKCALMYLAERGIKLKVASQSSPLMIFNNRSNSRQRALLLSIHKIENSARIKRRASDFCTILKYKFYFVPLRVG